MGVDVRGRGQYTLFDFQQDVCNSCRAGTLLIDDKDKDDNDDDNDKGEEAEAEAGDYAINNNGRARVMGGFNYRDCAVDGTWREWVHLIHMIRTTRTSKRMRNCARDDNGRIVPPLLSAAERWMTVRVSNSARSIRKKQTREQRQVAHP